MSAEQNKAIVRRYFEELWNKGDLSFIEEYIGPDVTHSWGHEDRESWRVAANTDFTATYQRIFHMRNWGTWPPTGKSIDFREMIFFHFADGKIVEHWEAWNSRAFEQLLRGEQPQATTTT